MKKIERILLVQPPATSFILGDITPNMPLGLAYIAAVLEGQGYDVRILDTLVEGWFNINKLSNGRFQIGLSFEEIKDRVRDFNPQIVGISGMFTAQWHNVTKTSKMVKAIDKNIVVVVGGAHPTATPETAIRDESIDFVVIGEGEMTFLKLIKALENGNGFDNIKGLAFKNDVGNVINYEKDYIEDLDSLPFPARHLLLLEKYFAIKISHGGSRRRSRFSSIVTSRGCPAKCIFCSAYKLWGRKYRARSPQNVIEEIKMLKAYFGIEELSIEDDNFTLYKERVHKICDLIISEHLNIVWDTPNGIATYSVDEDLIKKMKESGCYRISFPIESGNQEFLSKVIKKPLRLDRVPRLVNYAKRIGLEVNVFFVVGIPGETEKSIKDTFKFSRKIGIYDPFISIATPYPGTPMLELCIEKGFLVKDFNPANLTIHQYNIETPELPIQKIKKILEDELRKLRFYYLLDTLKNPNKLVKKMLNVSRNPGRIIKKIISLNKKFIGT